MPFPIKENYIQRTETTLGLIFPASYRMKMQMENGGEVSTVDDDWRLFPFFDSSDAKRASRTCNDLIKEGKNALSTSGFPQNGVAIGENDAGDYLVFIQTNGDTLPEEVFLWRHETRQLEMVAKSFQEFTQK